VALCRVYHFIAVLRDSSSFENFEGEILQIQSAFLYLSSFPWLLTMIQNAKEETNKFQNPMIVTG
jgi:hypothetical protein